MISAVYPGRSSTFPGILREALLSMIGVQKVLIPGDVVYADYAIGRFDLHGADGGVLKKSLLRLAELEVEILLPGHNRVVKGLKPGYIRDTAKQWAPYLK